MKHVKTLLTTSSILAVTIFISGCSNDTTSDAAATEFDIPVYTEDLEQLEAASTAYDREAAEQRDRINSEKTDALLREYNLIMAEADRLLQDAAEEEAKEKQAKLEAKIAQQKAAERARQRELALQGENRELKRKLDPLFAQFSQAYEEAMRSVITPNFFMDDILQHLTYTQLDARLNTLNTILATAIPESQLSEKMQQLEDILKQIKDELPSRETNNTRFAQLQRLSYFIQTDNLLSFFDAESDYIRFFETLKAYKPHIIAQKQTLIAKKRATQETFNSWFTADTQFDAELIWALRARAWQISPPSTTSQKATMYLADVNESGHRRLHRRSPNFTAYLQTEEAKNLLLTGRYRDFAHKLLLTLEGKRPGYNGQPIIPGNEGLYAPLHFANTAGNQFTLPRYGEIDRKYLRFETVYISPTKHITAVKTCLTTNIGPTEHEDMWSITFAGMGTHGNQLYNIYYYRANIADDGTITPSDDGNILVDKQTHKPYWAPHWKDFADIIDPTNPDNFTIQAQAAEELLTLYLENEPTLKDLVSLSDVPDESVALALSSGAINLHPQDASGVSLRSARTHTGGLSFSNFSVNGTSGANTTFDLPVFVQLNGQYSANKTTNGLSGAATLRMGNTVVGAIQAYANTGNGFDTQQNAHQLETSAVASHSFHNYFAEAQLGVVSADNVHISNWSGTRTQFTVGYDGTHASPFVQVLHRNLTRDGNMQHTHTFTGVGVDMDIANLVADSFSLTSRLQAKAGVEHNTLTTPTLSGSRTQFTGSVEWASTLNLTSGVSFGTNLSFNSTTDALAAFNFSVEY